MKPLTIAMISHLASATAPTGAERSLTLLAEGLAERGHRVAVATPNEWLLTARLVEAGIEMSEAAPRPCWLAWYEPRSPIYTAAQWGRFALFPDRRRAALARWLRAVAPDVVHVNCLPQLGGAAIARSLGLPVVWHLREILPPGPRRRFYAARLRRDAARIVAVSEAAAAWVREEGLGERVTVVHNGVIEPADPPSREHARVALGLPPDGVVAGLFGQLLPHKGAREFLAAARIARMEEPALRFVLAGSGPRSFLDEIARSAHDGTMKRRVHLLPPQPDALELMAAADIVCLTTVTPDPLPRAILEGMAAGRPVVSFRSGGAGEMVVDGETGILVECGDVIGLAGGITLLARDAERRAALGEAGLRRAREKFSLPRHVASMEEVLSVAADQIPLHEPGAASRARRAATRRESSDSNWRS